MNFCFEDYSNVYYEDLNGVEVPASRRGKFVQLRNADCEYIVLSPEKLSNYHANIVERFCSMQNRNIPFDYNSSREICRIPDNDWEIVGGGFWEINGSSLKLYGKSKAYGSFDHYDLLSKNLKQKTNFEKIIINSST